MKKEEMDELAEVLPKLLGNVDPEVSGGIVKALGLDDFSRWEDEGGTVKKDDNKDIAIEKMKTALQAMCDCAAGFQGRASIDASEFMEKAGPVVANAASVLGEVDLLLSE